MLEFSEYRAHDASGLAELVRSGQCSTVELVATALAAIERLNPKLNAVVRPLADQARAAARGVIPEGPFRGVPLLLKDTGVSLAGVPTEYGSRYFKGYVRPYDSEIVRLYKQAGFVIVGKTNPAELGSSCSCETIATGPMHNPWDVRRIPGISSGGSAAAVAAGIVPIAHATDAGGSIRGPASWCGLVGLKPTRGRISYAPDAGEHWSGLATQHVVSRSVRDCAAILDCTAGFVFGDPYTAPPPARPFLDAVTAPPSALRVGFTVKNANGERFEEDVAKSVIDTARLLERLGHNVEEASPSWDVSSVGEIMGTIAAGAISEMIARREQETGVPPSPDTLEHANWVLLLRGKALTAVDLLTAIQRANLVGRAFAKYFTGYDIWLTPTMAAPAPLHGYLDSSAPDVDLLLKRFGQLYCYNSIYNISGLPAMTLPLAMSREGLPIGMMFGAGFGKEDVLFQLGGQLEQARSWQDTYPNVTADNEPNGYAGFSPS